MYNPNVVVITPTTGSKDFEKCAQSVNDQTYPFVRHLIVVDGLNASNALWQLEAFSELYHNYNVFKLSVCELPINVGADGWYGHRVFAAFPFLTNEDYVVFLDQDNWLEPNHIEELVNNIKQGYGGRWSYSLRNICDKQGNFICRDDCESLGHLGSMGNDSYHVDTSSFCVPRQFLISGLSAAWYGKWGADRQFYTNLVNFYGKGQCTGKYTLNYRLGGNAGSVQKEFFLQGNERMKTQFPNSFPWSKE